MDNATHAFAGLLMADATAQWIERRTGVAADAQLGRVVVALGIIAAELPDADLAYSGPVVGLGPLGYLLHHRGHTHTVVFAVAAALAMWWLAMFVRRRTSHADSQQQLYERIPLLALCVAGTLSHIALDYSNSYGVHPFWPFDYRWFYGDSVFIVEPWLWIVAIPPLMFGPRRNGSRLLLAFLLIAILIAAWRLGEMTPRLALAVTIGAFVWLAVQRFIPTTKRVAAAAGAWLLVTAIFVVSSAEAKEALRKALPRGEVADDIAATPGAGNPFCFAVFVVSRSDTAYRVRTAMVAPWSIAQGASAPPARQCRSRIGRTNLSVLQNVHAIQTGNTDAVTWGQEWSASLEEARSLATSRCEFAYALRFMRVPVWKREASVVQLSDARFGVGARGFSNLAIGEGACPYPASAWIPPWTPPRAALLH